jgi:hypothetical protein
MVMMLLSDHELMDIEGGCGELNGYGKLNSCGMKKRDGFSKQSSLLKRNLVPAQNRPRERENASSSYIK